MSGILYEQLKPRTIEYLEILQEECAETIQAISKMKRFGLDSYNPTDPEKVTNLYHFIAELGDVVGMIALLQKSELIFEVAMTSEALETAALKKQEKVKRYLQT
jgi:NTP pyrophosphatase (non-canonical NTP hydrolase)